MVYDDRIGDAEIAEPFATLADPDLPKSMGGKAPTHAAVSSGGGSSEGLPVELAGLEPAPSWAVVTARLVEARLDVSRPTALRLLARMEERGVLREWGTGQRGQRRYVADELMDAVSAEEDLE